MSMIACYEPDFVRSFLSHHPGSPLQVRMMWQDEVRESLMLTESASCKAALGNPDAFALNVTQCKADPTAPALPERVRVLNQAALHCVTLTGLAPELHLYALGIMLSYAEKLPGDSDVVLARLAALPQILAEYVEEGKLQHQYASLPCVPGLQCRLLTLIGGIDFDWQPLPESARKLSLPLQMNLLMMQDANSEALLLQQLHQQWQDIYPHNLAEDAFIFSHYLIYRLYHDVFPHADDASVSQRYFELVSDFVVLRTLFSLWTLDGSPLGHDEIYGMFALAERWRHSRAATAWRQQLAAALPADYLLSAFSLLVC
ncbi:TPA: lysine-N-methylase [Citrobacter sedlakii]|nr:lysine-N-methylase [Citrobacter sedlakii]EKX8507941.1 lysine-N-methylase [Citrobacter sedlakii]HCA7077525.1 lysine-N-methylase [Citrobacter sedlakii]HCA7081562.1 lysine-N-methylase [Citrobacter sedlakii]HCA7134868.1 lysine-N-methylase [Citrobacter sedlakii]